MENKEQLPGPVILDVEPISCSMTMTRSREPDQLPNSLSMRFKIAGDDLVRTHEERALNGIEWTITFYENGSGNEFTQLHNAIGMLNYYAARHSEYDDIDDTPEACYAWANLDSEAFALLRDMAQAGKLPAGFRLNCYGISYGWEPDGSGKVWDVLAHNNAIISKIEVIANFVKPPEVEDGKANVDQFWTEPKPESPELIAARAMTKAIGEVNVRLGWIVGLLVATVLLVAFQ